MNGWQNQKYFASNDFEFNKINKYIDETRKNVVFSIER